MELSFYMAYDTVKKRSRKFYSCFLIYILQNMLSIGVFFYWKEHCPMKKELEEQKKFIEEDERKAHIVERQVYIVGKKKKRKIFTYLRKCFYKLPFVWLFTLFSI